ncbi:hypothetical protein Ciccas_013349 [Cichlidogyrus casuarinus]|uniref:USP domain-containing protein n=1 Tax=Cichlidogyrus casuarinus TaxID=1844966 RepID=A0ABD2PLL0_9PLAT
MKCSEAMRKVCQFIKNIANNNCSQTFSLPKDLQEVTDLFVKLLCVPTHNPIFENYQDAVQFISSFITEDCIFDGINTLARKMGEICYCGHTLRAFTKDYLEIVYVPSLDNLHQWLPPSKVESTTGRCPRCSRTDIQRTTKIEAWPNVLLIASTDPTEINLFSLLTFKPLQDVRYNLKSVLVYEAAGNGHYYTYGVRGDIWYMFNDSCVKAVNVVNTLKVCASVVLYEKV